MKKILAATVSALAFAYAGDASAQTINYGSLQELFGEPVTTSATGKPQKASEAPVAMDIITADDIRHSGAQTIPQILGRVDGVLNFQETRSWSDVGMRGQNTTLNPTLLVLVNGRQVYIDTYGYTDWSLIPVQLEEIRQIEVVKGPNTALFGFNAVSGVVNIVTYNPKYDKVTEVGGTYGSGEYRKAHAIATVSPTNWASVRLSGSLLGDNEFNDVSGNTRFAAGRFTPENHFQNFNLDSLFQVNDKTQLRLEGSVAEGHDNDAVFYGNTVYSDKRSSSEKVTLTSQTGIGLVEADVYQNQLSSHSEATPAVGAIAIENTVTVAQLQDLFKIGTDHSFRLMGEYRYNTVEGAGLFNYGDVYYNVWAGSAMWNWAITPKWELTNAVRVDELDLGRRGPLTPPFTSNAAFDQSTVALSENSGLVWKATDFDTFRASFARGIQAPSLVSYGIDLSLFGGFVDTVGQPNLKPSVVTNYEVGYDRLVSEIGGKIRGDIYYKDTRDVFTTGAITTIGVPTISQAANVGDTHTEGAELKVDGRFLHDWTWSAGYAYQTTDDNFWINKAGAITVPLDFQDTFPHHVFNGHLGWAKGPWEADAYAQLASSYKALTTTNVSGVYALADVDHYGTLSARIAYTFDPGIIVALSGLDITQATTATSPGLEEDRQVFLSLTKKF